MSTNYLLLNRDYTVYNAITWGNCLNHARRAWTSAASCSQRIFHGTIAFVELVPIVSQIASLFEMAIASLLKPSTVLGDLARRKIRLIQFREPSLPHQTRARAPPSDVVDIALPPPETDNLDQALFPLRSQIDSQYRALPWPAQMQKIVVLTLVEGGRGDIAAAAKAIALMQKLCPTLTFDWVLQDTSHDRCDPVSFLNCDDPSKVHVRYWQSKPPEKAPGDLLLIGPVNHAAWKMDFIESRIQRKIAGPTFGFVENGKALLTFHSESLEAKVEDLAQQQATANEIYQSLHPDLFPTKLDDSKGLLPMGLQPGTGVFLDQSRIEAPLSRGYCCPSYLPQIQDAELRKDILEAMNVFDGVSEPDYD